jgi:hypothetical protein
VTACLSTKIPIPRKKVGILAWSIPSWSKQGLRRKFEKTSATDPDGWTIGGGREANGLYLFDTGSLSAAFVSEYSLSESVNNKERVRLWYTRLGHASLKCQQLLFPMKWSFSSDFDFQCETCKLSKHCRSTFPLNNNRSESPFYLIHSDVWGPAQVVSIFGFRYSLSFIDDCTRYTWIYLLKSRDEVSSIVKIF